MVFMVICVITIIFNMQNENNNQGFVKDQHYPYRGQNGIQIHASYTGQVNENGFPHGKGIMSVYRINNGEREILCDTDGTFVNGNPEGICTDMNYATNQKRTGNYTNGHPNGYGLTEYGNGNMSYDNASGDNYEPNSKIMMYKLNGSQGTGTYFGTFGNDGKTVIHDNTKFVKGENIPKKVFEMGL